MAEAIALLDPVVTQTAAMGAMFDHLIAIIPLGEAHLLDGRLDEARRFGARAVDVSIAHRERGHQAWALRLLGEIAATGSAPDRAAAERHYGQALDLAGELGMRPLIAHCHLGLGKPARETRKRNQRRSVSRPPQPCTRDGYALLAGAGGVCAEGAGLTFRPRNPSVV